MGHKVNPIGLRIGISKSWNSRWFSEKSYSKWLKEDLEIQDFIKTRLNHASISKVEIDRTSKKTRINIHSARPGIIIGRKGDEVDRLKKDISKRSNTEIIINIKEIKRPEIDAKLIAENIAGQLEKRVAFRRAMKRAMSSAMRVNIAGCKIMVSGRLNGAEIARSEWIREGQVRLHTLKSDIDYGLAESHTTYGIIGVKVWVYKGYGTEKNRNQRTSKKD